MSIGHSIAAVVTVAAALALAVAPSAGAVTSGGGSPATADQMSKARELLEKGDRELGTNQLAIFDSMSQEQKEAEVEYYFSGQLHKDLEAVLVKAAKGEKGLPAIRNSESRAYGSGRLQMRTFDSVVESPAGVSSLASAGVMNRTVGSGRWFVGGIWQGKLQQVMNYDYYGARIRAIHRCKSTADGAGIAGTVGANYVLDSPGGHTVRVHADRMDAEG